MPSSTESLSKVFVYGTLKRDQPNHYWFWKPQSGFARFVAAGRTVIQFPLLVGTRYNVPFMLNKPGIGNYISGEIYEVDELMLNNLDVLEDYPLLYDRVKHEIAMDNGTTVDCWVYLLRNFPEKMLLNPLINDYKDSKERPYCERSKRLENLRAIDDLDYVPSTTSSN